MSIEDEYRLAFRLCRKNITFEPRRYMQRIPSAFRHFIYDNIDNSAHDNTILFNNTRRCFALNYQTLLLMFFYIYCFRHTR